MMLKPYVLSTGGAGSTINTQPDAEDGHRDPEEVMGFEIYQDFVSRMNSTKTTSQI